MDPSHQLIKRLFDFIFSLAGLLLLWPLILICVLLAKRDTQLPGLFIQNRVGRHGKFIRVKKIRTMRKIKGMHSSITVEKDARITPIGAVMRRWKLDELPQLWNVLVGDMSFVGPRPDVPGYADMLAGDQRQILQLRPGITGPATIKYRDEQRLLSKVSDAKSFNDNTVYPDKVELNLDYLQNWSLVKDVGYILMTLGVLSIPDELNVKLPINGSSA